MTENEIPWINCVGFGVDNASVNIGTIPLKQECWKKKTQVYFIGCPCHIFHNTARSACARFSAVTGFDVDDFCVDFY